LRICLDLDGVICELRQPEQSYSDVTPIPGAAEAIRELRAAGHYVIIHTARHMKTCNGNVAMVLARQGAVTLQWLADNGIEYDELLFGKPWADIYIDDNAHRFVGWDALGATLGGLLTNDSEP
jgi:capsule biosynthesis phosphatase